MSKNRFVQISTLTPYAGVLLNRDQSGMSKRLDLGGEERTRISSQYAKRKLRLAEGAHSIKDMATGEAGVGISMRSRYTLSDKVAKPLYTESDTLPKEDVLPKEFVVEATLALTDVIYKPSAKALKERVKLRTAIAEGKADLVDILDRKELIILGRPEIEYLQKLVHQVIEGQTDVKGIQEAVKKLVADKEFKKNLRAVGENSPSLDVAMFGRMITGDALSAMDAAVHVAHGFAVHRQDANLDFFTAVDDLVTKDHANVADDEEQTSGTAHMGETEITSPLLYGYYVIDLDQLEENLKGLDNRREIAARLVEDIVHLVSTAIVGAKKGSTAPYSTSDFVLVEYGVGPCRSLASAFRKPVRGTTEDAVAALSRYMQGKDDMYGTEADRWYSCGFETTVPGAERMTVPAMAKAVGDAVLKAE